MSHSMGEVWSADSKLLGYFEYNGTCDVARTRVYQTPDDVSANWRGDNDRKCVCGGSGQPVLLYTTYGGGFCWDGRVCWNCMAITNGIYDFESSDGRPFPVTPGTTARPGSPAPPSSKIRPA
jgi:hypothetical protein